MNTEQFVEELRTSTLQDQPPLTISYDDVVRAGRRRRGGLMAVRGVVTVGACAALAIGGGMLLSGPSDSDSSHAASSSDYNPQAMPSILTDAVLAEWDGPGQPPALRVTAYGQERDNQQLERLDPARYDEATGWDARWESADGERVFSASLIQGNGGDVESGTAAGVQSNCDSDLRSGVVADCAVSTLADGRVMQYEVYAFRSQQGISVDPSQAAYFVRMVTVFTPGGDDFEVKLVEQVAATSPDFDAQDWLFDRDEAQAIAATSAFDISAALPDLVTDGEEPVVPVTRP